VLCVACCVRVVRVPFLCYVYEVSNNKEKNKTIIKMVHLVGFSFNISSSSWFNMD